MAEALSVALHAMAEESANGSSVAVDIGGRRSAARLVLEVLAGTSATLNVTVQTSNSASGPWKSVGNFPTVETAARVERSFSGLLQHVQISWTLAAAVTFAITGEVHTLYATPEQIECGPGVLEGIQSSDKAKACIAASGEAEAYLSSAYTLPITAWPAELTRKTGIVAAWNVLFSRGIRPDGADEVVMMERDRAVSWFKQIKMGQLRPPGIIDSTPARSETAARVISKNDSRGW